MLHRNEIAGHDLIVAPPLPGLFGAIDHQEVFRNKRLPTTKHPLDLWNGATLDVQESLSQDYALSRFYPQAPLPPPSSPTSPFDFDKTDKLDNYRDECARVEDDLAQCRAALTAREQDLRAPDRAAAQVEGYSGGADLNFGGRGTRAGD